MGESLVQIVGVLLYRTTVLNYRTKGEEMKFNIFQRIARLEATVARNEKAIEQINCKHRNIWIYGPMNHNPFGTT